MELDDMKLAWQTLDRRLEKQNAIQLQLLRDSRLGKMRSSLGWLKFGQSVQIMVGALLMLVFAPFWVEHRDSLHLALYGLSLHAYGLMFVLFAARDLYLNSRVDYSSPVLEIQKQLAELRAWRVRSAVWFAVTGCVSWIPFLLVVFYWLGADVWVHSPQVVFWLVTNSLVCLLLIYAFVRWARHPKRSRLAKYLDDSSAGRRISQAQAVLDEVALFEKL